MLPRLEELSIEVTNQCTLACLHCSSGSVPQKAKGELTYQEHRRLLGEARALGATTLSLSGGNPLLYQPLVELVSQALIIGYERILIYTTGHNRISENVWDHPSADWLIHQPVTWIFSLHSHNAFTNDYIMNVPGTTKAVVGNIGWLVEQGAKVEVHMVPMRPNYEHIPQVRDLCAELGVKKLSLLRFVPQTRGKAHNDQLGMDKRQFLAMQMIIRDEMVREHPVQLRAGCPIDFRHAIGDLPGKARPCHAGDDLILVRPTGAVHPCAAWKSLPADANVRDSSLEDIWTTSIVFNAIRQFKAEDYHLVGGCATCKLLDSCKAGCPAQRLHVFGVTHTMDDLTVGASDPLCPRGNGHEFVDLDHK